MGFSRQEYQSCLSFRSPECFPIVVLEKTLESPLESKETKPMYPKGNQPWIFIGRTDAEAETPILWPSDWDLGSSPGSGRSLEKRMATHSSILAWSIPWTEEPGRLQSMGSQSWTWVSDWHKRQTPHPSGGCWLLDAYNYIPKTSPRYLSTNQLEESPPVAPLNPNVASKHHCLKSIRNSGSFKLELPVLLTWCPTINNVLSFTTTRLVDWLCCKANE